MKSYEYRRSLREAGIIILTGEACGVSMRVLCDVTENGKALLCEFWGVGEVRFADNWNSSQEATGSVMLTRQNLTELLCFHVLRKQDVVMLNEDSGDITGFSQMEFQEWRERFVNMESEDIFSTVFPRVRIWMRSGTAACGLRNRHEMTGRVG